MKKILALLALLILSGTTFAGDDLDIFGQGENDEFQFERFSEDEVFAAINAAADTVCRNGVCTLHSVTTTNRDFTIEFMVGEGDNVNNNGGTTIITGGGSGLDNGDDEYIGLVARASWGKCTQDINVPRSLYVSMNRYLYSLMDEEGDVLRGFTPAQEAMIMFYTTLMKQGTGCNNVSNRR